METHPLINALLAVLALLSVLDDGIRGEELVEMGEAP